MASFFVLFYSYKACRLYISIFLQMNISDIMPVIYVCVCVSAEAYSMWGFDPDKLKM